MAGRPSNHDERYTQVMDALVRCVARFGLDGATLSAIALEAGLSRPLIRHHLGNRNEIISSVQSYVLDYFKQKTEMMISARPEHNPGAWVIDSLFSGLDDTTPEMVLAFAALTMRSVGDPELQVACRDAVLDFEAAVAKALLAEESGKKTATVQATAQGIVALYFNTVSLAPLQMPKKWTSTSRQLAEELLNNLKESG